MSTAGSIALAEMLPASRIRRGERSLRPGRSWVWLGTRFVGPAGRGPAESSSAGGRPTHASTEFAPRPEPRAAHLCFRGRRSPNSGRPRLPCVREQPPVWRCLGGHVPGRVRAPAGPGARRGAPATAPARFAQCGAARPDQPVDRRVGRDGRHRPADLRRLRSRRLAAPVRAARRALPGRRGDRADRERRRGRPAQPLQGARGLRLRDLGRLQGRAARGRRQHRRPVGDHPCRPARQGRAHRAARRAHLAQFHARGLATAFGVHRAMDTAGAMLGPIVAFGILLAAPGAFDAVFAVSLCFATLGLASWCCSCATAASATAPRARAGRACTRGEPRACCRASGSAAGVGRTRPRHGE